MLKVDFNILTFALLTMFDMSVLDSKAMFIASLLKLQNKGRKQLLSVRFLDSLVQHGGQIA